jgi:hypothetical protein
MNEPNGTAAAGMRGWSSDSSRSGIQRLINRWEYRHLRVSGAMRVVGGSVAIAAGVVCLSYDAHGWAVFFLVIGTLNLAGGGWYLTIARSRAAQ